jgi:AcrR family transcriptional regulator
VRTVVRAPDPSLWLTTSNRDGRGSLRTGDDRIVHFQPSGYACRMSGEPSGATPAAMRPLRADAARNRSRILAAARAAFAESGLDVGVEEIARRAGVGKGTLYRRFPTKEALVRAIFEDRLDELEGLAVRAEREPDAWEAFSRFMADAARMQASNQGFLDVVAQRTSAVLSPEQRRRMLGIQAGPLQRAQAAGCLRGDLVPEDVTLLLRMVGAATRAAPGGGSMEAHWPRYLALLLDGLRPDAARPLPAEPWRAR